MKRVPCFLQSVLWSCDVSQLDLQVNKSYIVNQILSYGTLKEFRWLFKNYSLSEVVEVFLKRPTKGYTRQRLHFGKNFVLPLAKSHLDERLYVRNTPRAIG